MEEGLNRELRDDADALRSWLINLSVGAAVIGIFQGVWWGLLVALVLLLAAFLVNRIKRRFL